MTDEIKRTQGACRERDRTAEDIDEMLREQWATLRSSDTPEGEADEGELACVEHRLKRLGHREKVLTEARDKLRGSVLASWEERGVTQVRVDDVLLHIRTRFVPQYPQGKDVAREMLKSAGGDLALLVSEDIPFQRMAAFLRECEKEERPLPPEFEGMIEGAPELSIGARIS